MEIVVLSSEHREGVLQVAGELGDWFTPRGREQLALDLGFQGGFVSLVDGRVMGFITCFVNEGVGHIGWMGVAPSFQRAGAGRALVEAVASLLASRGVPALEVDTLGDSVDYPPYEQTRRFYLGAGFREHRRVLQEDPEWPDRLTLRRELQRQESACTSTNERAW